MLDQIIDSVDLSFKWILITFNFITIIFLYIHQKKNKQPPKYSILFVTAHPDDEAMFFRPTILNLNADYFIHLLCLSGGETEREKELMASASCLKIHKVKCIKDQKLLDGIKQKWCEETIQKYVEEYIRQNEIKAVFTFDKHGISDHANHKAIYYALQHFKSEEKKEGNLDAMKIYFLETTCLVRKYSGLLEFPHALIKTYSWLTFSPLHAWTCMRKHASQFVWYRQLWVMFSRYEYINSFQRGWIKMSK